MREATLRGGGKVGRESGFSLVEMVMVVAVIGIMGFLAAGQYSRLVEKSRETVARNVLEVLNQGVSRYGQVEGRGLRVVEADDESWAEELDVLRALQWVDPRFPGQGGPYVRVDYNPAVSSDEEDYRAVWNGAFFELRRPGMGGPGLLIDFGSSDLGRTVEFGEGFVPLSGYEGEEGEEEGDEEVEESL